MGHAGSDIESSYLSINEIEETEKNDPLLHSARIMIDNSLLSSDEILGLYEQAKAFSESISKGSVKAKHGEDKPKDQSSII